MKIPASLGIGSWVFAAAYFMYEPFAMAASTAPYNWLLQPMSDLGVTECGVNTYPMAGYEICSPHAPIVNSLFLLTSLAIIIGSLFLYQQVKMIRGIGLATILLIIFAVGNGFSLIPANVSFMWHTIPAVFSMLSVGPALWLYGRNLKKGKWLSYSSSALIGLLFIGFFMVAIYKLEIGGLLQRIFYGVVYIWGISMSWILIREESNKP
ncbi:DUF998 domain-containing protein [Alkalicoccobacillus murimartini]|uniref:DUF998 domain-containing protein n=1 Tax=Alkalicoccobacillus murimartini TaxID=171685 RepID=A0ABT9YC18_9BACI|nr:DUF998 domain-containing protein [Alkalicoccobacillus murimartini]MDQ0205387.1 hypothetical protein [Alkalicoccobacillus murimartini]